MSSAPQPHGPAHRTRTDALELYKLAREEELRRLESQRDELDSMRQRTAQYLAFVGAATAFLAGSGLKAPARDGVFYGLAALASILSLWMIFACVRVFLALEFPASKDGWRNFRPKPISWAFVLKPGALLAVIESDLPRPDEIDLVKYVASLYGEMSSDNAPGLAKVRRMYVSALVSGAVQVIGWTALVWVKA
jgi:hypothetical protein